MKIKSLIKHVIPYELIVIIKRIKNQALRILSFSPLIKTDCNYTLFSCKGKHTFFGYYDISPFNSKNEVLYHEVTKENAPAEIFVNTKDNDNKRFIASTHAWNWQQGARLRWFPGSDDKVMFNDFDGSKYYCRVVNINTKKEEKILWPLYDISEDGKFGLSLDFTRLGHRRPGYGYTHLPYDDKNICKDGIYIISISENKIIKIVTYEKIAEVMGLDKESYHNWYLNHLSFSPSSNKFLFFFIVGEGAAFNASLLVYDFSSDTIKVLEKKGKVSHYDWLDDDTIICTCYENNVCTYNVYHISSYEVEVFNKKQLCSDGHPTYINSDSIISDTYPNNAGYQTVFYSSQENIQPIAMLFDWKTVTAEKRTDLHPRLSQDHNYLSIDSNMTGKRNFIIINIENNGDKN